jgi:glycosyltransferase involved in cell wall biosynthesis
MAQLVSILIPAYNAQTVIGEAIESAIRQTWPRKEIIVVDDGSSDDTLSIAKRFESRAVKVLSQKNRGASATRNRALSLAQGEYIQWLDADDLLAPDKISQQLRVDKSYGALTLLSSSWGSFFFQPRKARFIPNRLWQDSLPVDWIVNSFSDNIWMGIESWLVSRKLTEMAGPWNEQLLRDNDGEYFCRVVCASKEIKFVREAKCYCRMGNEKSISSEFNMSALKIESVFSSICLQINYLRSIENSERTKAACLKNLQHHLIYFYPDQTAILEKADALAKELGGALSPPALSWKYSIMRHVFGWRKVKRAQQVIPYLKMLVDRNWSKLSSVLFRDL